MSSSINNDLARDIYHLARDIGSLSAYPSKYKLSDLIGDREKLSKQIDHSEKIFKLAKGINDVSIEVLKAQLVYVDEDIQTCSNQVNSQMNQNQNLSSQPSYIRRNDMSSSINNDLARDIYHLARDIGSLSAYPSKVKLIKLIDDREKIFKCAKGINDVAIEVLKAQLVYVDEGIQTCSNHVKQTCSDQVNSQMNQNQILSSQLSDSDDTNFSDSDEADCSVPRECRALLQDTVISGYDSVEIEALKDIKKVLQIPNMSEGDKKDLAKAAIENLPVNVKNPLFGEIWDVAENDRKDEPRWGENHCVDNLCLLDVALDVRIAKLKTGSSV